MDAISREFPWANVAALARANRPDMDEAAQALKHARRPRIHTFIATSDIHLKYKLKKSRQQVLDEACAAVTLARSVLRRRGVFGRRRHAHGLGLSGRDLRARWSRRERAR